VYQILNWYASNKVRTYVRTCLHVSAAMRMRSSLLWGIMQHRVVVLYRRFGTTYLSHLHFVTLENGTDMLSRNVGKGLLLAAALYPRRLQISKYVCFTPQLHFGFWFLHVFALRPIFRPKRGLLKPYKCDKYWRYLKGQCFDIRLRNAYILFTESNSYFMLPVMAVSVHDCIVSWKWKTGWFM
jgi:hypothetical protein